MGMSDPFNSPAFNQASMTAAINLLPNNYGLLQQRNVMPVRGVRHRTVIVEERNGVLNLLPTLPRGAPGTAATVGKRKIRSFVVPHIPHDDLVKPDDVQGLRSFGSESMEEPLSELVNDRLQTMRNKHGITLEHLRMGALKGVILDADGSTLADLFSEFEITSVTAWTDGVANRGKRMQLDMDFGGTKEQITNCNDIARHIEANLQGEQMSSIHALCSPSFFDNFTTHDDVTAAYARWEDGAALRNDMRAGFPFGRVMFEEYSGVATDGAGNVRLFIPDGEAIAFPVGTMDTFATYAAPADFNEAVNTLGLEIYAKQERSKFDRGWELHTQSNPLPMCHRPSVLVRLHSST